MLQGHYRRSCPGLSTGETARRCGRQKTGRSLNFFLKSSCRGPFIYNKAGPRRKTGHGSALPLHSIHPYRRSFWRTVGGFPFTEPVFINRARPHDVQLPRSRTAAHMNGNVEAPRVGEIRAACCRFVHAPEVSIPSRGIPSSAIAINCARCRKDDTSQPMNPVGWLAFVQTAKNSGKASKVRWFPELRGFQVLIPTRFGVLSHSYFKPFFKLISVRFPPNSLVFLCIPCVLSPVGIVLVSKFGINFPKNRRRKN